MLVNMNDVLRPAKKINMQLVFLTQLILSLLVELSTPQNRHGRL